MCLSRVDVALKYNRAGQYYYGVGYKSYTKNDLVDYGLKLGEWVEACGGFRKGRHPANGLPTDGPLDREYHAGFHTFLNKKDAIDYQYADGDLYEVHYCDILAFGQNDTKYADYAPYKMESGPCVVSRWIKVVKKCASKS